VEKRVLRVASIHPRSSVSCAAVRLQRRFTAFADHVAHSRPFVNTRPSANGRADAGLSGRGRVGARRSRETRKARERWFRVDFRQRVRVTASQLW